MRPEYRSPKEIEKEIRKNPKKSFSFFFVLFRQSKNPSFVFFVFFCGKNLSAFFVFFCGKKIFAFFVFSCGNNFSFLATIAIAFFAVVSILASRIDTTRSLRGD